MNNPVRLRLSRAKGFELQAHSYAINGLPAVSCARPGPWGNPFVVGQDGTRAECVELFQYMLGGYFALACTPSITDMRNYCSNLRARRAELRGKNLACWCALDGKSCHCDVLLEVANG